MKNIESINLNSLDEKGRPTIAKHLNNESGEVNGKQSVTATQEAGVTYTWRHLNVRAGGGGIFKKTPGAHILKDVSGLCKGGQLLAIMGASGAGKTSLLNVLTFRSSKLIIEGDIYVNGRLADSRTIAGVSAYVQQEDLFTGVFSVREQLNFNAQLRIGKEVKQFERKRRIEAVMKELGLLKCADTMIGIPGKIKGISGGEKKRLAFACEMITNPLLLLCDEPTSGLDSFMASSVVKAMKRLTSMGKTVISTIHQPSSEVFAMFDTLLILAEGRVAFLGKVSEAHRFFTRLEKPCLSTYNPGDHFIYTLAIRSGHEGECRQFVHDVCDSFREGEGQRILQDVEESMVPSETEDSLSRIVIPKSPYRASWSNQMKAMLRRSYLEQVRQPSVFMIKFSTNIFFSLIFGLIFLNMDSNDEKAIQNLGGALFIFVTNLSFSNMFPVITVFSACMPLFLREHWNGMYRTEVYFLTRNLIELPIYIFGPALFVCISYYMVGFRNDVVAFFSHMLILIIVANVAVSYGYMISCLSKNYNTALVLSTPLTIPIMLFGGAYIKADTIPAWLNWISYFSWFQYGFEALSIIQWTGYKYCSLQLINMSTIAMTSGMMTDVTSTINTWASNMTTNTMSLVTSDMTTSIISNLTASSYDTTTFNESHAVETSITSFSTSSTYDDGCNDVGDKIIEYQGFNKDNLWADVGALLGLMVGFRVIAFFLLLLKTRRKN